MATCYCEIKLGFSNLDAPELEGLASHYKTATALSQHAAYLLTLQTPLVPGRSVVPTNLFRKTAQATCEFLWSCRSCEEMIEKLHKLAAEKDDGNAVVGEIILKIGVRLGRALWEETKTDTKQCLKFLEEFWARYLLYTSAKKDVARLLYFALGPNTSR
jgi:hypothetical protein